MSIKQIPQGMQDFLPDECYNKMLLQQSLYSLYSGYGISCVEPCAIEFCSSNQPYIAFEHLFKFTDSNGKLLALRSDPTVQLARLAVTRLNGRARACYFLNSYEFLASLTSPREREFAQAGVELIGGNEQDDLEAVVLAVESLLKIGVKDFKIEVGDVRFLQGIMHNLTSKQIEKIYSVIDSSQLSEVAGVCTEVGVDSSTTSKICVALELFGGVEVLNKGKELGNNSLSRSAIDQLLSIYKALDSLGYSKYVTFDLGFTPKNYYTGLVLKGYAQGYGLVLLEGGRYDNLCKQFGADVGAVGFCIGIRRTLACIKPQQLPVPVAVFVTDSVSMPMAFSWAREMRARGAVVRLDSQSQLQDYTAKNKVLCAVSFKNGVKSEVKL